jgi:DNA mismatch endonuclease, patch repair protein
VHRRPLPALRRSADILFPVVRVAVFVDGCFWHGCPNHGLRGHEVNLWYWPEKIERNRRRDADTDSKLIDAGWVSIRIWEHEDVVAAASRVAALVGRRRADRHLHTDKNGTGGACR